MIRKRLEECEEKCFEPRNGVVYIKENGQLLFYVPCAMEHNVIKNCHDDLGHNVTEKTIEAIKKSHWFPNMRDKVKQYISNCLKCIIFNPSGSKAKGQLHSVPKGTLPFQTVHLDHCGPLEKYPKSNKYILVIVDGFTNS